MTTDALWTRFVRTWRALGHEIHRRWRRSPGRVRDLVANHPLPWVTEQDWTWEVVASDGACVEKFMTHEEASRFICLAERVASAGDRLAASETFDRPLTD